MAVGLYGKTLPEPNGAPIRLVVPLKYGFYANVNPEVDHPRWSQKRERRRPSGLLSPNWREAVKFNGYGEQVVHLYKGMDLRKFY